MRFEWRYTTVGIQTLHVISEGDGGYHAIMTDYMVAEWTKNEVDVLVVDYANGGRVAHSVRFKSLQEAKNYCEVSYRMGVRANA